MRPSQEDADVILLGGDLTNFGRRQETIEMLEVLDGLQGKVLGVASNCDYHEVEDILDEHGVHLNGKHATVNKVCFAGIGHSLPCPGHTRNEMTKHPD